jgi:hypothetical protein
MAKRKSNRRRRAAGYQRRASHPPAGVRRSVKLDDLLRPGTGSTGAAAVAPGAATAAAVAQPVANTNTEPEPAPEPVRHRLQALPDPDPDGPHIRLGAAWAVATFVAAGIGVSGLAVLYAATAAVAALQVCRSWKKRPRQPVIALAATGAALLPLAAVINAVAVIAVAAAVALASLLYRPDPRRSAPALTMLVALGIGLAAASPVLVRRLGLVEVIVLLSLVGTYDASAFLVGTGAARWWEGPAAGIAFVFAVTLAAAAVFVPPFGGASPWLMGALAAVLAPLGPLVAPRLTGDDTAPVPGLRRLDSLLILGPIWTLAAYALL